MANLKGRKQKREKGKIIIFKKYLNIPFEHKIFVCQKGPVLGSKHQNSHTVKPKCIPQYSASIVRPPQNCGVS